MRKRILFKDEEISREIERRIEEERLKELDRMPSERQLAEEFGVQRDTVRCALDMLVKRRVLIKKPRQGYFVAPDKIKLNLKDFRSISKEIERISNRSRMIMLNFELISMSKELSEITHMPEGTLCYQILRIRYDREKPISLERSYLMAELVPGLTRKEIEQQGLSFLLRHKYGISLVSAYQRITQAYPDELETELLRIDKKEPIIRYEGMMRDRKDRLVDYFENVVMPDGIEFHVRDYA